MIRMSEESRKFVAKYLPEFIDCDDPADVLSPLYDLIMRKGFVKQERYNAFGEAAQVVYDDIFDSNYDS